LADAVRDAYRKSTYDGIKGNGSAQG